MFYLKNTDLKEPEELQIPHCSTPCALEKLFDITKHLHISPNEWEKECLVQ